MCSVTGSSKMSARVMVIDTWLWGITGMTRSKPLLRASFSRCRPGRTPRDARDGPGSPVPPAPLESAGRNHPRYLEPSLPRPTAKTAVTQNPIYLRNRLRHDLIAAIRRDHGPQAVVDVACAIG